MTDTKREAAHTPVADHIERRLRTWRQRHMNRSGDRLALDDFMDAESIDDLVDFVCDEYALDAVLNRAPALAAEVSTLRKQKDGAYEERNRVVAAFARASVALGWPVAVTRTAIEGWSEDWHGCIYIVTPNGQASWHFHDSHAYLFADLPRGALAWDGHTTPEKYERLHALRPVCEVSTLRAEVERLREENEQLKTVWGRAMRSQDQLMDRLAAERRKVEALREMVQESAALFRHYEKLHRDKGTTDSLRKAVINAGIAARCEAALSTTGGE